MILPQRLNRLRKKLEKRIPRGLNYARNDKNEVIIDTTEVVP